MNASMTIPVPRSRGYVPSYRSIYLYSRPDAYDGKRRWNEGSMKKRSCRPETDVACENKNEGLATEKKRKSREYTASHKKRLCDPLKALWYKMPQDILLLKGKGGEIRCWLHWQCE